MYYTLVKTGWNKSFFFFFFYFIFLKISYFRLIFGWKDRFLPILAYFGSMCAKAFHITLHKQS